MWRTHSTLLENVLNADTVNSITEKHSEQNHTISQILQDNFNDVKSRNEAMLFKHVPRQQVPRLTSTVSDVKVESFVTESDYESLIFLIARA
jgi:mediator of RNA polymerase II transcription subunit 12